MNDREFVSELKRFGDRICNNIFHMDLEWVDVAIQIAEMRDFCEQHAPEKLALFDMIYERRFHRLWETWRYRSPEAWEWSEAEIGSW